MYVGAVCFRNNIVRGTSGIFGTVGLELCNAMPAGLCWPSSGSNVIIGNQVQCAPSCSGTIGGRCDDLCGALGRTFCDLDIDPGFVGSALCLTDGSNPLINTYGRNAGWDMFDASESNLWDGAAPEVGAREHGVSRVFGGLPSTCDGSIVDVD
jgi:hypothetical protein